MVIPENGVQTGFFAGLSVLAIVSAMDMTNGGLYASLMNQYGSKEESGAFVLMSLESGPLMTMVILAPPVWLPSSLTILSARCCHSGGLCLR